MTKEVFKPLPVEILGPISDNLRQHPFFEKYISKKQLAQTLSMSEGYINKLMLRGLPHFKFGRAVRFKVSEVAAYLEKRRAQ